MANIMTCDDAAFMRMQIKKLVEEGGHTVVAEASTGLECVELYDVMKPDIILMDITMPDTDGIEATKRIIAKDPNARIIMVSAVGITPKVVESIESGAKDFIVKPFTAERILACINKYAPK